MENFDFYIGLIQEYSYLIIALTVFVQAMGLPCPGGTFMVIGGVAASLGFFNVPLVILIAILAAFLGYNIGYLLGRKYGRRVLKRIEHIHIFHPEKIGKIEQFFKAHGNKTIFLGRLLPVFRTYVAVFAGIFKTPYAIFSFYNLMGATMWVSSMVFLGYLLGNNLPLLQQVFQNFGEAMIAIAVLATILIAYSIFRKKNVVLES